MAEVLGKHVGRLAPSPTGALHLGNVRTFMIAWLRARSQNGTVILRMEDLDHPKDKPGADVQAIEDLAWLGFDWDKTYVQSRRKPIYKEALDDLRSQSVQLFPRPRFPFPLSSQPKKPKTQTTQTLPLVYPCTCTRRDVESAQSAPHAGEQLHYPGTCRGRYATFPKGACWRFLVPEGTVVAFDDAFAGPVEQDVSKTLGDFPLARDEGGAGYTLACTVDDLLMGVTEVVRGDDLLPATPAQILLARALAPRYQLSASNCHLPSYCHVPLVVGPDGKRLAKRHGDSRIATYREQGKSPEEILGFLAASCGWCAKGERISLRDLIPRFTLATIPHSPFVLDSGF
jgi:glutamyl-tRNA synthetase